MTRRIVLIGAIAFAVALAGGCGGSDSSDAECQAQDDAFDAAGLAPFERQNRAAERQARLIAEGAPATQRRDAQVAYWQALVDQGNAARSVVPCSAENKELRLLTINVGQHSTTMLTTQEALDMATDPADVQFFRAQWAKNGEAWQESVMALNRYALNAFGSEDSPTSGG